MFCNFISGNIKLEKWTANSIRRAGLCADHFNSSSFKTEKKKTLKRDAVPIRFNDLTYLQEKALTIEIGEMQRAQGKQNQIREMKEIENTYNNAIAGTSLDIDHNDKVYDNQLLHQFKRTYPPATLNFNESLEEENITEWMHLEPVRDENIDRDEMIDTHDLLMAENYKEKNNPEKIITNLKRENVRLRQIIKRLKLRLQRRQVRPKKKISKKNNKKKIQHLINEQDLHPVAKAMIHLQLHTPHAAYTEEEKTLSKQLFYYSASAFRRLRKTGCNFPAEQTIRRWHKEFNIMPGFCDSIFRKLQEKISKLPIEQRVCALKWDEMYIKSYEEYLFSLDQIEGLVDLGPLGRKSERAKCVFVFCLDSLNARHPWRQPLAYFLPGKCMKAEEIVTLVKECLDRLSKTSADVRLITCDQGSSNQSAYAQFGVSSDKMYFIHNEKKYYASFDFPHLVKRLASLLRKHKYLYCDGKIIASYADYETTWSIDNAAQGGSNLLSHITAAHLRPNSFEAMNVKRAFQLFSNRFAAAIKTAGYSKQLKTNTWEATADFTEYMNKIIDACNSYSLKIKFGGKRPLSSKNQDIEILLRNFVEWCSRWSLSSDIISQIPCLKGFTLTIPAIFEIYKELKEQYETFELATGLCNQDSVEHLFSKLRQRGGFNPNPTARMVRLSFRHILSTGYIQTSDKGNIQCPEAESLINPPSQLVKTIENALNENHVTMQHDIEPENELLIEDAEIIEKYDIMEKYENISLLTSYDQNAITFFAGYIARRSITKINCDNCRDIMMKTPMDDMTENEKYIEFREYPNMDEDTPIITKLIRPTTLFTNVIETQLMVFNRVWQHYWASTHILDKISNECVNLTNEKYPEWFDKNNVCYNHRLQALKFMISVKLYSRTRYNNRNEKSNKKKFVRKVKNLQNK